MHLLLLSKQTYHKVFELVSVQGSSKNPEMLRGFLFSFFKQSTHFETFRILFYCTVNMAFTSEKSLHRISYIESQIHML